MENKEYEWDYLDKRGYNNNMGRYRSGVELKFIASNCRPREDKILDIAGGSGRIAIPMLNYSRNITVNDINENALRILKERNLGIQTVAGDFTKVEFKDKYSLILCIEGPDYFHNWNDFFNTISTLLADNGKFIFTYTNPSSWRYRLRKLKNWRKSDPYHVVKFKELKKLLNSFNLEIENVNGFNWTLLPVSSNSPLVHFFSTVEKGLGLNKWFSQSPWLMVSIKKR